jgi:flavin-dependent dehydrogenase
VDRYRFDKMLVDRAKEVGVDFREGTQINDLLFDAE